MISHQWVRLFLEGPDLMPISSPLVFRVNYNSQDMETLKRPLADEWVEKMWYMYILGYYSALNRMK